MRCRQGQRAGAAKGLALVLVCLPLLIVSSIAAGQDGDPVWAEVVGAQGTAGAGWTSDAYAALDAGDSERALEIARQAGAGSEDNGTLLSWLNLLYRSDNFGALRSNADVALGRLNPRSSLSAAVLFFRSLAHMRGGDLEAAAEDLERAIRYRSELSDASLYYGNLAEVRGALGELETAAILYRQALSTNPSYVAARAGLAAVLERLGDSAGARTAMIAALAADPTLSFLNDQGWFFVTPGEEHLYRALMHELHGRRDAALVAIGAFAEQQSDAVNLQLAERISARLGRVRVRLQRFEMPGCVPVHVAADRAGRRLLVQCSSGVLLEGPVVDEEWNPQRIQGHELPNGQTIAWDVADLDYTTEASFRILFRSGSVVEVPLDPALRSEVTVHHFGSADLGPHQFIDDASRVVFIDNSWSGFQIESVFTLIPVVATRNVPGGFQRIIAPESGDRFATFDGSSIVIWGGDPASTVTRLAPSTNYDVPAVWLDEHRLAVVGSHGCTIYSGRSGAAVERVFVPAANAGSAPFLALDRVDDDTLVGAREGEVLVIDVRSD